jgi:hypothetical protein
VQPAKRHTPGRPPDTMVTCHRFDSGTTQHAYQCAVEAFGANKVLKVTAHCFTTRNHPSSAAACCRSLIHPPLLSLLGRQAPNQADTRVLLRPGWACMLQSCALVGSPAGDSSKQAARVIQSCVGEVHCSAQCMQKLGPMQLKNRPAVSHCVSNTQPL